MHPTNTRHASFKASPVGLSIQRGKKRSQLASSEDLERFGRLDWRNGWDSSVPMGQKSKLPWLVVTMFWFLVATGVLK